MKELEEAVGALEESTKAAARQCMELAKKASPPLLVLMGHAASLTPC